MKSLVRDFLAIDGNRCAFIQDESDLTVGVILQSKMQADAFAKWPGSLVMDWTYNTNSMGFHLGTCIGNISTPFQRHCTAIPTPLQRH
jgi:hypothetical protein